MTSGQSDIKRTTELMDDCRRHGLEILPPSINESDMDFSVNSKGQIRFGLKAISGMGEAAADAIISEREKNGPYTDIFNLLERVDLRSVNRKNIEVLVKAGALDGIGEMHRAQYFYRDGGLLTSPTYLEKLMRWSLHNRQNADNAQMSIFDMSDEIKQIRIAFDGDAVLFGAEAERIFRHDGIEFKEGHQSVMDYFKECEQETGV